MQLEFKNEAGDALIGKRIMFNWQGVGWCEGKVECRNTREKEKIGKDHVNFWIHYECDDNTSKHNLELVNYAHGDEADTDSWVLLERLPDEEAADKEVEDGGEEAPPEGVDTAKDGAALTIAE